MKHLKVSTKAFEDLQYWKKYNRKKYGKIKHLIQDILETPFQGIGKPEPLRYGYSGCWSRRVDNKNRLVYKVEEERILIISCRFHYQ